MPHGLSRKIRIAFILQVVMASLAIVIAFFVVGTLFKYSFVRSSLQEEARHYWELREAAPAYPPPSTYALRAYLVKPGESSQELPAHLRKLDPGFHELKRQGQMVWVERNPGGTRSRSKIVPDCAPLHPGYGRLTRSARRNPRPHTARRRRKHATRTARSATP